MRRSPRALRKKKSLGFMMNALRFQLKTMHGASIDLTESVRRMSIAIEKGELDVRSGKAEGEDQDRTGPGAGSHEDPGPAS